MHGGFVLDSSVGFASLRASLAFRLKEETRQCISGVLLLAVARVTAAWSVVSNPASCAHGPAEYLAVRVFSSSVVLLAFAEGAPVRLPGACAGFARLPVWCGRSALR